MEKEQHILEKVNADLREALAKTVLADQEKTDYMVQATRSIRIPMNTISGMTTIARRHIDDHEKVLDCLDKIDVSSSQLMKVVNEFSDIAELDDRTMLMSESPFFISELILQTIAKYSEQALAKNISIRTIIENVEHEHLLGDQNRLFQMLGNLIANAVSYTMPGGKITVRLSEEHAFNDGFSLFNIIIEDTGIGMTPEFMSRMYTPFERMDDPRIAGNQGVGLGLPISLRLARMMSGNIQATSEFGKGSTFTVSLHLRRREELRENHHEGQAVLIVGPTAEENAEVAAVFEQCKMSATIASDAASVRAQISAAIRRDESYCALVVVFGSAGDMAAYQLSDRIIEEFADKTPPLIFITNWWDGATVAAINESVHTFISRPFSPAKLLFALEKVYPAKQPAAKGDHDKTSLAGKRILVAEDNELNAEMIKEILEQHGIIVELAANGIKVLDMLLDKNEHYYDCILMDIRMPIMDGYATTRRIRSNTRNDIAMIPIIAMTADAYSNDVRSAKSAGMDAHIAKPPDIDEMLGILKRLLGGPWQAT